MKIACLIDRSNLVRYFAPVMVEVLRRGHQVICLLGQTSAAGDPKAHLDTAEGDLPAALRSQVESFPFTDYAALELLAAHLQPDAIISTQEQGHYAKLGLYVGPVDHQASCRVLDTVEERITQLVEVV